MAIKEKNKAMWNAVRTGDPRYFAAYTLKNRLKVSVHEAQLSGSFQFTDICADTVLLNYYYYD